jgi:hypothetical protein
MNQRDHIIWIYNCAGMALTVISLILLFYGAYLFDSGLTTKTELFTTVSIPLVGAIICAAIAAIKNWR